MPFPKPLTPPTTPVHHLLWAGVVAAAALALEWALSAWASAPLPFIAFGPATFFTAAALGRRPATLVMLGGVAWAFTAAGHGLAGDSAALRSIAAYGGVGVLLIACGGRLHLRDRRADRAEQRLSLAQDETGVGLFELDYRAGTAYASPALCQILGQPVVSGSMPLQQWLSALDAGHVEDSRRSLEQKMAAGELHYERELRIERPNGQLHWLLSRIRLELDSRGQLAIARGATLDITARKQLLTELELAQAQLREQLDDLGQLHRLGNQLLAMPYLNAALQAMLDAVCALHDTPFGVVHLQGPASGARLVAHRGLPDDALAPFAAAIDASVGGVAAASGHRVIVADIEADERCTALRPIARSLGLRALHATPLLARGGGPVLGIVTVLGTATNAGAGAGAGAGTGAGTERLWRLTDLFAAQASALIEREQALVLARETRERFEVALQSSPVPFTILAPLHDAGGRVVDFCWTYANPAAAALLDRPADELLGRRVLDVLPHAWNEPGMLERYVQVSERGLSFEFETLTQRPGQQIWLRVVASPLNGSVVVWFSDITQRREEQLALREADRRKDEFLATLAHELRNPLAPIRHAVAIVRDAHGSPAQHGWSLDVIERQLQRMALLLDDLLDVSRVTRGALPLRRVRCALQAIVAAAVETARPLLEERRHRLVLDVPEAFVWVDADPLRIGQVLGNLLVNAAKYTAPGGEVRLAARAEGGDAVVTVTDTGHGLHPDDCERVFEMFTQLSAGDPASGSSVQNGLGIGLALSRRLMQLHGGRLDVHSAGPGLGCTFIACLPAAPAVPADAAADGAMSEHALPEHAMPEDRPVQAEAGPRRAAEALLDTAAGSCCRILVADDNRDAADSLALLLGLDGHDVQVAYDGREAMVVYRRFRPGLALLDMNMPGHSGSELARLIRDEQQAPITLVAVTGLGQPQDREHALQAGFDEHLVKPVPYRQLQALIDALMAPPLGVTLA